MDPYFVMEPVMPLFYLAFIRLYLTIFSKIEIIFSREFIDNASRVIFLRSQCCMTTAIRDRILLWFLQPDRLVSILGTTSFRLFFYFHFFLINSISMYYVESLNRAIL